MRGLRNMPAPSYQTREDSPAPTDGGGVTAATFLGGLAIDGAALLFGLGAALAIGLGLVRSIRLRWVCDDIFITFRYIDNWFDGFGLVYNAGERVEGYTHFLWLVVLAAARAAGFNVVGASMWIGIAAYVGTIVLLALISWRMTGESTRSVPFAALALALNYDANVWASSGLETSFLTWLLVLAFFIWFFTDLALTRRLMLCGTTLALATLTRPDAALFLAGANGLLIASLVLRRANPRLIARDLALLNAGPVALLVPYAMWKVWFYGDLLPATYYAKSGGAAYFEQGLFYVWLYFKAYFSAALFLLAAPVVGARLLRARRHTQQFADARSIAPAVAFAAVVAYLVVFVAKVGGDFMFARFLTPMVPFFYYLIEDTIRGVAGRSRRAPAIIMTMLLVSIVYENHWRDDVLFYRDGTKMLPKWDFEKTSDAASGEDRGIVDERWFYSKPLVEYTDGTNLTAIDAYAAAGKWMRRTFDGLTVSACVQGEQNIQGYYAAFKPCINSFGLTDKYIAALPITHRGRIGHEKTAPAEYLARRHVAFKLSGFALQVPETHSFNEAWFFYPDLGLWQSAEIMSYDRDLFAEMRRRLEEQNNPSFITDYDAFVPYFISTLMPTSPVEITQQVYDNLKLSYFDRYPNPEWENAMLEQIRTHQ